MAHPHNRTAFALSPADLATLLMVVVIKAVVLIYGVITYQILNNERLDSLAAYLEVWNRWDGPHYLDIARNGYQMTGDQRFLLVFYPLYPWAIRLFTVIFRDTLISALAVSTIASLAVAVALYRLVALDYPAAVARRAVWFLFIFPASYFLHTDYTESLFIALVLAAFLAARHDRWMLAGVLGMLAGLTHVNGLLLLFALGAEAVTQWWRRGRFEAQWLWTGLIPLALLFYFFINYRMTGDATAFLKIEADHWVHVAVPPWDGIAETLNVALTYAPYEAQIIGVQVLLYMAAGLVATVFSAWTLPLSYTVWMAANWILFASQSWNLSAPRYMLAMFPLFILTARLARHRYWETAITSWSLLWLGFFASQFVVGHWTF